MPSLLPPLVDVLTKRGLPETFLSPSTWGDLQSPLLIEGMKETVERILAAVASRQRILIFGDYDCDGILSTAILNTTLRKLGAQAVIHLPHRDEGYGFTVEAVHRASLAGTDLVITIDNGINAAAAVNLAQRLGIDVVIVDHHQIETRAATTAVWSDRFCAAGLGLMVSWAMLERQSLPEKDLASFLRSLSRLAAIASVADCVPLTGATRTLTRIGLDELGKTRHAGLRRLLIMGGVRYGQTPNSEHIAFRIAPRINAAGRVGHPIEAFRMLNAATAEEQIELAVSLDQLNKQRRKLEAHALKEMDHMVVAGDVRGLVLYSPDWKKGIAGILASRAGERYGVPAFVLVKDARTGLAVGSGRSIAGVSLIDALRSTKHLLVRYGGHHQAAGVTVTIENIPAFRECFDDYLRSHPPGQTAAPEVDANLNLEFATPLFHRQLSTFGPFGVGNPAPIFAVRNATVKPAATGFVLITQGGREMKVRSSSAFGVNHEGGLAVVALNGSGGSLVSFTSEKQGKAA